MTKLTDQELKALLAAGCEDAPDCQCPAPAKSPYGAHEDDCPWVRWLTDQPKAELTLEALAPDLARQVLDLREAGGALAAVLKRSGRQGYWKRASWHLAGYEAHTDTGCCTKRCIEARKALARWAELGQAAPPEGETEVRDGES